MRRVLLLAGIGLLAWAIGLVARLPADRVLAWFAPAGVEVRGASGTLWEGRAARVDFGQPVPVRSLTWDLSAWRLVTARAVADVAFDWAGLDARGTLASSAGGDLHLAAASVRGPVAGIARAFPGTGLALEGRLVARIDAAALADGRIADLAGRMQWSDAAVTAPLPLELGEVRVDMAAAEGEPGHRLDVTGDGGALGIDGRVELQPDGRYRADIRLQPTARAPDGLRETLGMFARRDGDAFRLRRSGRLPRIGGGG